MVVEALTGVLVVITGFHAYLTFRILKVNRDAVDAVREIESSLRLYVTVKLILSSSRSPT